MKKFKDFYLEQTTVGLVEYIEIDGIGQVAAKIDSGNQGYNVLHGVNITPIDDNKIKFQTIDNQTVSFTKRGFIKIHVGQTEEMRPVISLNIKLGDQFYKDVPFSVTDRSQNDEPVLIGEPFLKQINAVIDVNKEQLQESPLIDTNFRSKEDEYKQLLADKKTLEDEIAKAYNETAILQSREYFDLNKKMKILNDKIKKVAPISKEKGAIAFKKLKELFSDSYH